MVSEGIMNDISQIYNDMDEDMCAIYNGVE